MPARLTIDLDALVKNYHFLQAQAPNSTIAAVLKANAYGLGLIPIAKKLYQENCHHFFVGSLNEALFLKKNLPKHVFIAVLHGFYKGSENIFAQEQIYPVLNHLAMAQDWQHFCHLENKKYPALLQIDTGMHRLGLPESEFKFLAQDEKALKTLNFSYILSHLANSELEHDVRNQNQKLKFQKLIQLWPKTKYSLANSGGVFLGPEYHFDLIRSGIALFGMDPRPNLLTNIKPVVFLDAPILQIQNLKKGEEIGYNGLFKSDKDRIVATIEIGYADGLPRALSNNGFAYFNEHKLPIIGAISMDLLSIDITSIAHLLEKNLIKIGDHVNFIGKHQSLKNLAQNVPTIGYEILTSLSPRLERVYKDQ